jgi:preprotein translocase subunit SecA
MFSALLEALKEESVGFLFNVQVQVAEPEIVEDPAQASFAPAAQTSVAPAPAGSALSQLDGQTADGGLSAAPAETAPVGPAAAAPALAASVLGNGGLTEPPRRPLTYTGPAEDGGTEVQAPGGRHAGTGASGSARNAPCPCGSGKKYKRCHGAPTTSRS